MIATLIIMASAMLALTFGYLTERADRIELQQRNADLEMEADRQLALNDVACLENQNASLKSERDDLITALRLAAGDDTPPRWRTHA
jgi:hypothetical protein